MCNFLKAVYKEDVMCYCVTKEDFMRLKDTYVRLRMLDQLPAPKRVVFNGQEQKEDAGLELGKKIFGDLLKVREE
jgi:hypothetical protein